MTSGSQLASDLATPPQLVGLDEKTCTHSLCFSARKKPQVAGYANYGGRPKAVPANLVSTFCCEKAYRLGSVTLSDYHIIWSYGVNLLPLNRRNKQRRNKNDCAIGIGYRFKFGGQRVG